MNVAYLFTFFLVVVIALFLLLPFIRQDKSTFEANPTKPVIDESIPEEISLDLGRDDVGSEELQEQQSALAEHEMEIEVAVKRARLHKSTFSSCPQCGHQMQSTDRFCASCGQSRQSS